jgi:hypothetical protein
LGQVSSTRLWCAAHYVVDSADDKEHFLFDPGYDGGPVAVVSIAVFEGRPKASASNLHDDNFREYMSFSNLLPHLSTRIMDTR